MTEVKRRKNWVSQTGFQYEFHILESGLTIDGTSIEIFFALHGAGDTGYEFPTQGTQIKWDAFPEHAALVGDDVKEAAQSFLVERK